MAFVPVTNAAQVEIRMLADLQRIENTLWFQHDGAITPTDLNALGSAVLGWWNSDITPILSGVVVLREVYSTDQTSSIGGTNTQNGGGSAGALTGRVNPANASLAVSFRTAARGRSFRGRNYFPLIEQDQMSGVSEVSAPFAAAIITAYNDLLGADALVTGWTWCVASRFSGVDVNGRPIPRVTGLTTEITRVVITDLVIDSQRRRLPGRGT